MCLVNPKIFSIWLDAIQALLVVWCSAEAPILWPPDAKSQLIGKDPDTGKTEDRRRRGWQRMRREKLEVVNMDAL